MVEGAGVEEVGDNRPPVYWEGDTLIIRASAIGTSCLWELVAAGQGYDPYPLPDVLVRAFREGHELEPVVVERLKQEHRYQFVSHQMEGNWLVAPGIIIRYHPDGLLRDAVVEIKALGNELWQKAVRSSVGKTIDEYPWQASVMMHDTGLPLIWVAYNKGTPPINDMGDRELCADVGKLHFETLNAPPISRAEITEKALLVRDLIQGPDIILSGRGCDDFEHWPCRYTQLRPQPTGEEGKKVNVRRVKSVGESDRVEVDRLAREYVYYKGVLDESTAKLENAKSLLLAQVGEDEKGLETDQWIIPVVHGSVTFTDWQAMGQETKDEINRLKDQIKELEFPWRKKRPNPYLRDVRRKDEE